MGRTAVLVLTMPGFGSETLRHVLESPACPRVEFFVGLLGKRPSWWRYLAAKLRFHLFGRIHRLTVLSSSTLCSRAVEYWLMNQGIPWAWLKDDEAVWRLRAGLKPTLTLTVTSCILFSKRTLMNPAGNWFNVHPGLLPDYAGAVPAPYMYLDNVGGCSIQAMSERIDAGSVVEVAPMTDPLGADGGEFYFERLSVHTAARMVLFMQRWLKGELTLSVVDSGALRFCSSARLKGDRQLDWSWPQVKLVRWVKALVPMAPAWLMDSRGRKIEVIDAKPGDFAGDVLPGTVTGSEGRWISVACANGNVVSLLCRRCCSFAHGTTLPIKTVSNEV